MVISGVARRFGLQIFNEPYLEQLPERTRACTSDRLYMYYVTRATYFLLIVVLCGRIFAILFLFVCFVPIMMMTASRFLIFLYLFDFDLPLNFMASVDRKRPRIGVIFEDKASIAIKIKCVVL